MTVRILYQLPNNRLAKCGQRIYRFSQHAHVGNHGFIGGPRSGPDFYEPNHEPKTFAVNLDYNGFKNYQAELQEVIRSEPNVFTMKLNKNDLERFYEQ